MVDDLTMPESRLRTLVLALAGEQGWLRKYDRNDFKMRSTSKGDSGFPDLVLLRAPRLIIAELKDEKAEPYENQERWHRQFRLVSGIEFYLWRPSAWINGIVERALL